MDLQISGARKRVYDLIAEYIILRAQDVTSYLEQIKVIIIIYIYIYIGYMHLQLHNREERTCTSSIPDTHSETPEQLSPIGDQGPIGTLPSP